MTVELPSDRARAGLVTQVTAVEQARAVAEVQAAVVVAQQVPRDLPAAVEAMRESCRQRGLADRAFYRFPRAGSTVSGPSVHLARELARCWGNVQYGIREMRRDDAGAVSEMQAWAWDVQTNTRSEQMFVVPHRRDTTSGPKMLTDLRDVYENNANQGARRLREAIFSVLPTWFTEEAKELCQATIRDGGGRSLAQQVSDLAKAFDSLGVPVARVERRFGPRAGWSEHDLAQLRVIGSSIRQGTVTLDEEFGSTTNDDLAAPPAPVTTGAGQEAAGAEVVEDGVGIDIVPDTASVMAALDEVGHGPMGPSQRRMLHALLPKGLSDQARHEVLSEATGRVVDSETTLTRQEASAVIEHLRQAETSGPQADQRAIIADLVARLDVDRDAGLALYARVTGRQVERTGDLSIDEARRVIAELRKAERDLTGSTDDETGSSEPAEG